MNPTKNGRKLEEQQLFTMCVFEGGGGGGSFGRCLSVSGRGARCGCEGRGGGNCLCVEHNIYHASFVGYFLVQLFLHLAQLIHHFSSLSTRNITIKNSNINTILLWLIMFLCTYQNI